MKIAVITKKSVVNNPVRLDVLNSLKSEFDIYEYAGEISDETDCILVFGGDGTVLEAVKASVGKDISILGINLGNLGFLTEFESSVTPSAVKEVLLHGSVVERALIDVSVDGEKITSALNEAVIKSVGLKPITVSAYVDGNFADNYHADGLIVSTPTGSTAYSLSAGGPVLAPNVDALIINPICAHSLHSRPLVVSGDSVIDVAVNDKNAEICIDGSKEYSLANAKSVRICKSKNTAKFLSGNSDNFYSKLLEKMNVWGITQKY